MIFENIFAEIKWPFLTRNTANYTEKVIATLVVIAKFLCRKWAKIAQNSDHNIGPST
jgi:hypothetical protein